MKKIRKLLIFIVIILLIGFIAFVLTNDNDKKILKEETYEISFKVNPLVKFKFNIKDDKAIIKSVELINEKAKEIFKEINFIDMELNDAINLYGDKLTENKINFNTIYIFTNYNNKDYFKSDNYKLDVNVVDSKFLEDIENNTKEELVLNKKYIKTQEKDRYDYIIFKENGMMEYAFWGNEYKTTATENYYYTLKGNNLKIQGREEQGYFGWVFSYDTCIVEYNRIKCDYYFDTNYDLKVEYIKTEYYEIES